MNKYILFFICLLFVGCTDGHSDPPIMELCSVILNGDKDYIDDLDEMPFLTVGDELDISLILDGNGNTLRSFILTNNHTDILKTTLFFYEDEIASEFTEIEKGILGYKDGVSDTWVIIKVSVLSVSAEETGLSFYLNSKATDCGGASNSIILHTGISEEIK